MNRSGEQGASRIDGCRGEPPEIGRHEASRLIESEHGGDR